MKKLMDKLGARGAGGGGGKESGGAGRAPIEAPDSLRSRQNARVLDLICEGEIEGLVDGLKSVYLDETPIQNADGTYNFKGVNFLMRNGTQTQAFVPGFGAVESEQAVSTEVTYASPVVRSVSNPNLDALRVTVSVPQLTLQNTETGDLNGTSVTIAIDVQNNGGGYVAQPLRNAFVAGNFSIVSATQARTYYESTRFSIAVKWTPQDVARPQTCKMQLQYRLVGDVSWIAYETYTFTGNSQAYSTPGVLGGTMSSVGYSRTFNVALTSGLYEFRLVKLTGSLSNPPIFGMEQPPSIGTAYGGSVSITSGQIYQPILSDVITGKTTKRYQRDYRIELPSPGPWDIRVRRLTADSVQTVLQNKTYWDSYTEIIDTKLSYPNSVVAGLQIDAQQFRAIPSRGFLIRGLKVRIPSNYDPLLRTYDGAWDGTFVTAWSNNPAWVFYDLLTSTRYGLGNYIDASLVDKWALYSIAQYCDETVDDGLGGIEPRFTLNTYIQTREDAFTVINNMASIFRAMVYWSGGGLTAVQDAPTDPVALFTAANVINGSFNYSGSSAKSRHTVVLVAWNDPRDNYKQKIEYVEDADGISRYGVIQTQVYALGCTSRGQAHRYGRAIIYTEQMESETITFSCGLDGTVVYPGAIINVQDQFRSGVRFGGRVVTADASNITIDSAVTLESGKVYTLSCVLPDASIEDRTIVNAAGSHTVLVMDAPFSDAPQDMAIWMVSTPTLQVSSWRVVAVSESDRGKLDITALAYRSDKYAAIEDNLILEPINYTNLRSTPDPVQDLSASESLTLVGLGIVGVKVLLSWQGNNSAVRYIVRFNLENENITEVETANTSIELQPVPEGYYTFSVIAVSAIGRQSQATTINTTIYGKTLPPVDVSGFSVIKVGGVTLASWALHPDIDVQVGGQIVIRFSSLLSGVTWEDGVTFDTFAGNTTNGQLPLLSGTYMAKALDSSGNWSENMVSFAATEGLLTGFTTVGTSTQHSTFSGVKSDTAVYYGSLRLASAETIASMPGLISTWPNFSSLGGVSAAGSYYFSAVLDLTTVLTRRFESHIKSFSYDTQDLISYRGLISEWGSVGGQSINDCDATLMIATTNDNPAGSPTWTAWAPFFVGDFTCRAAKFRLDLTSGVLTHNIDVTELSVVAKIPA